MDAMQLFIDVIEQNQHGIAILDLLGAAKPKQKKTTETDAVFALFLLHLKTYKETIQRLNAKICDLQEDKRKLQEDYEDLKLYFEKYVSGAHFSG